MGRVNNFNNPTAKVRLFKVEIDSQGYDMGGAYWGHGMPLYAAIGENFTYFTRSLSRETVKSELKERFPELKFYR